MGSRGRHSPDAESLWGAPKIPNNVTSAFFNTVHLLPKDLSFEHGSTKPAFCPRRHLTSLRPWSWLCKLAEDFRKWPSDNFSKWFFALFHGILVSMVFVSWDGTADFNLPHDTSSVTLCHIAKIFWIVSLYGHKAVDRDSVFGGVMRGPKINLFGFCCVGVAIKKSNAWFIGAFIEHFGTFYPEICRSQTLDMHWWNVVICVGDFVGMPCDGIVTSNHGMGQKKCPVYRSGLLSDDCMSLIVTWLK